MEIFTLRANTRFGSGIAVCVCILAVATSAGASLLVYGTTAPMTGSRTVASPGLATSESDWQDAVIDWSIVDNGNNTYTYIYTFSNFNKPGISHVTLDLSDNCINGSSFADPNCVTDFKFNGTPSGLLEAGDIDGITGAVKFDIGDDGDLVYSFVSNRSPVFGDLFIKGGSSSELTNTGFGDHANPARTAMDFIARPNGHIPEPATLFLLCGAAVPVLLKRRRKA